MQVERIIGKYTGRYNNYNDLGQNWSQNNWKNK